MFNVSCGNMPFGASPRPVLYQEEVDGKSIWAYRPDEEQMPIAITSDSIFQNILPGEQWFKFPVDSGKTYSLIVDAGNREDCDPSVDRSRFDCIEFELTGRRAKHAKGDLFEYRSFGFEGSLHGVQDNYSPAKAALMFTHDSTAQFFYFKIRNRSVVALPASIRILSFDKKVFGHPLTSPVSYDAIAYFNLFRHRTRLFHGLTRNGHDGVDLASDVATDNAFYEVIQEVIAVADGEVLKAHLESCAIGNIVWVKHDTPYGTFTSMYAHMSASVVVPGQKVKKGERLGYILEEPLCEKGYSGHLHFEMWDRVVTEWYDGYSSGNGQIDPIPILFEK